ncbi:MAG: nickel-dependent lactate racemase [Proteobacteria bacterium]|nr:nickel-dependent lactate racemase [Pseudomonadota bacterium]
MRVALPYGKSNIAVEVPDNSTLIVPDGITALKNERDRAFEAMANPIGTPPLNEIVGTGDRVAIVISDITRPTPNHKIVPWIIEMLEHVPKESFVIINGTGTHRDNSDEELVEMLGRETFEAIRVVNHSAFSKEDLQYLGKSESGSDVFMNKEYCEADIRIVTGFIEPHFFAGFSGGPKGIMPGIAGIDTIMHFHNAELIGHPQSTWGVIEENPIQEEATEIALMCRPDFMLNVALNQEKEITNIFAGDVVQAHRAGARYVKEHAMIACDEPFDIVVTTNSGYPLDQNLYQAVKGMSAAHQIVKKGGSIICVAECSEGIPQHGNFGRILRMRATPQEILDMINAPGFSMFDQWEAQKMAMIQIWADIYVYSELTAAEVVQATLAPVETVEKTLKHLSEKYGGSPSVAVIPQGPLSIPYVRRS